MKKAESEQIINDAVKKLIKNHLEWSGSYNEIPSRDIVNVRGEFIGARLEEHYTVDEWEAMSDAEREKFLVKWNRIFDRFVAEEADRKWEAVKVILDI